MIEYIAPLSILLIMGVLLALSIRIVRPTQRGLIERFGKYRRHAKAGITFLIPFVDQMIKVNITEQMVDAKEQEIITKDNLNAGVDAQIYFKVQIDEESVKKSQYSVDNYKIQIVALARTTLRDIIGKLTFREVNSMRGKLNGELQKELDKQTKDWGIQVVKTELKEISPPKDVQETMNKVLKAENEKEAAKDMASATETEADGERRAAIQKAEGRAKAVTLQAEAEKKATILKAEAEEKAIQLVNEAAQKYFKGQAVELKKLQVFKKAFRKNTKVIVSSDLPAMELISKIASLKEEKETDTKE